MNTSNSKAYYNISKIINLQGETVLELGDRVTWLGHAGTVKQIALEISTSRHVAVVLLDATEEFPREEKLCYTFVLKKESDNDN